MQGPVSQPSVCQRRQANITAADSPGAYDKWLGLDRWQGGVGKHWTSAPQAIAGYEDTVKPRNSSHVYPKTSGAHIECQGYPRAGLSWGRCRTDLTPSQSGEAPAFWHLYS